MLLDKKAPTCNGGHIWIPTDGGEAAVSEAYAKQFQEDARKFLRNRAEEMRSNGMMFILSTCHAQEMNPLDHVSRCDIYGGYFEQAWNELVEQVCLCYHPHQSLPNLKPKLRNGRLDSGFCK